MISVERARVNYTNTHSTSYNLLFILVTFLRFYFESRCHKQAGQRQANNPA